MIDNIPIERHACSICFYDVEDTDVASDKTAGKCNHVFHEACLNLWLAAKDTCPDCRRVLTVKPLLPARALRAIREEPFLSGIGILVLWFPCIALLVDCLELSVGYLVVDIAVLPLHLIQGNPLATYKSNVGDFIRRSSRGELWTEMDGHIRSFEWTAAVIWFMRGLFDVKHRLRNSNDRTVDLFVGIFSLGLVFWFVREGYYISRWAFRAIRTNEAPDR